MRDSSIPMSAFLGRNRGGASYQNHSRRYLMRRQQGLHECSGNIRHKLHISISVQYITPLIHTDVLTRCQTWISNVMREWLPKPRWKLRVLLPFSSRIRHSLDVTRNAMAGLYECMEGRPSKYPIQGLGTAEVQDAEAPLLQEAGSLT
jgi:hypothetical protein